MISRQDYNYIMKKSSIEAIRTNKKLFLFVPLLLIALSAFMLPIATVNAAPTKNYLMAWGVYTGSTLTYGDIFQKGDINHFSIMASWTTQGATGSGVFCDITRSITVYLKVTKGELYDPLTSPTSVVLEGTATITCGQWAGTYGFWLLAQPSKTPAAELDLLNSGKMISGTFGHLTCGTVIALPPLA
jgi:hypothetical protein